MAVLSGDAACLLDWDFDSLQYTREKLVELAVKAFEAFNIPSLYHIPVGTVRNFVNKARARLLTTTANRKIK
eukprot:3072217-Pyramimonas_sp.AAC.3